MDGHNICVCDEDVMSNRLDINPGHQVTQLGFLTEYHPLVFFSMCVRYL